MTVWRRPVEALSSEGVKELHRLQAENAKLRELVRELYDSIDSVFWDGEYATKERLKPLLRELGIEVQE